LSIFVLPLEEQVIQAVQFGC